jgi:hypothetical protein
MLSSQPIKKPPSHSPGPRKKATSVASEIAVSLNFDSGYWVRFPPDRDQIADARHPVSRPFQTLALQREAVTVSSLLADREGRA